MEFEMKELLELFIYFIIWIYSSASYAYYGYGIISESNMFLLKFTYIIVFIFILTIPQLIMVNKLIKIMDKE